MAEAEKVQGDVRDWWFYFKLIRVHRRSRRDIRALQDHDDARCHPIEAGGGGGGSAGGQKLVPTTEKERYKKVKM